MKQDESRKPSSAWYKFTILAAILRGFNFSIASRNQTVNSAWRGKYPADAVIARSYTVKILFEDLTDAPQHLQ